MRRYLVASLMAAIVGSTICTAATAHEGWFVRVCPAKTEANRIHLACAIEAFDRAIAADPGFALAHAARAHVLLERGNPTAAHASMGRPILSLPVCPRGRGTISRFSACFWRATPKARFLQHRRT
jgi:hypothetical protein